MSFGRALALISMIALLPVAALASGEDAGLPTVADHAPYAKTRAKLIAHGFKPVSQRHVEESDFIGNEDVAQRYSEARSCAGTGLNPCFFAWRDRKGQPFTIITHGEGTDHLTVEIVERPHS